MPALASCKYLGYMSRQNEIHRLGTGSVMTKDLDHQHHEGTEKAGLITLAVIILGLILVGIFIFALAWAMSR
jgi:hypothetical protein